MPAQRDIAIQPGETSVTAALRVVASLAGGVVLYTTNGKHSANSYHYVGQAVDIALPSGPSIDSPELGRVALRLLDLVPKQFIREFIWAGPLLPVYIKNGRDVAPYAVAIHRNHIHLAVSAAFTYEPPKEALVPDRPRVNAPVVGAIAAHDPATGDIKGYILIGADGGTFHFGAGVPQLGNVEYVLPQGNDWTPSA